MKHDTSEIYMLNFKKYKKRKKRKEKEKLRDTTESKDENGKELFYFFFWSLDLVAAVCGNFLSTVLVEPVSPSCSIFWLWWLWCIGNFLLGNFVLTSPCPSACFYRDLWGCGPWYQNGNSQMFSSGQNLLTVVDDREGEFLSDAAAVAADVDWSCHFTSLCRVAEVSSPIYTCVIYGLYTLAVNLAQACSHGERSVLG